MDAPSAPTALPVDVARPKDLRFWLIFISINVALFLSAIELTAVSTALPTIANALHADQFAWVGSAYALASTAFLPMSGGLAQIFGRRPALLASIALFTLGSGLCGGANDMGMMIAGRTVQGMGGGGIQSLSAIILSDIVSLHERGAYAGVFGLTWSIASVIGPLIGGSLAAHGQWRWLFYLNIPIAAVSAAFVLVFLNLPTPPGSFKEKFLRLDWTGNFLVISSSVAVTIALTWGGIVAPWGSPKVLVPLILGLVGLAVFMVYEVFFASDPLVPAVLISNQTSISGYFQTFFVGIVALTVVYFMPVYYQGCKDASAMESGILTLALASLAPAAIIAGVIVNRTRRYRPQMWAGWALLMLGLGVLSTVHADTPRAHAIGFNIMIGVGIGFEYSTTMFPVQAPLAVSQNARALAFLMFVRSFAGVWGITIGSVVLQNEMKKRLPEAFLSSFPRGIAIIYAAIPQVPSLPEPLKHNVQVAFSDSLTVLWQVTMGVTALGIISSLFMKGLKLHTHLDKEWALEGAIGARSGSEDLKGQETVTGSESGEKVA